MPHFLPLLWWCFVALPAAWDCLVSAQADTDSNPSNPVNMMNQLTMNAHNVIDIIVSQAALPVQHLYVDFARGRSLQEPNFVYRRLLPHILKAQASSNSVVSVYVGLATGEFFYFDRVFFEGGLICSNPSCFTGCGTVLEWAEYNTTGSRWYALI
jgi:hypothetical protein